MGFQFSKLDGIQTEIDDIYKINKFLPFAKCVKMFPFWGICIQICTKQCIYNLHFLTNLDFTFLLSRTDCEYIQHRLQKL
jgi:hypothetical protein